MCWEGIHSFLLLFIFFFTSYNYCKLISPLNIHLFFLSNMYKGWRMANWPRGISQMLRTREEKWLSTYADIRGLHSVPHNFLITLRLFFFFFLFKGERKENVSRVVRLDSLRFFVRTCGLHGKITWLLANRFVAAFVRVQFARLPRLSGRRATRLHDVDFRRPNRSSWSGSIFGLEVPTFVPC